jgi:guanylate kinase
VSGTGLLFVISAPSGAGKRTVLAQVRANDKKLAYSVSTTSRPPRADEVEGRDYHFVDREEFEQRVANGQFAEWAEVHGNLYGTERVELDRVRTNGQDVILELDIQGMRSVKRFEPESVAVFIQPPSMAELSRRLRHRATESPEVVALRLKNAEDEMKASFEYDYVIVNREVKQAVEELETIIASERNKARERA